MNLKIEIFRTVNSNIMYCVIVNLSVLKTFLAIIESGSLVRASERLNVTQSTVTARLKSLEEELGQTLLIRQKSGTTLTPSGIKLKRYAEVMTELWRQARQEAALPEGIELVCNIGCHFDLWPHHGKPLFEAIRREQPAVALSAWPGGPAELADWLNAGLIDLALTYQPPARAHQSQHALPHERLVLVSTDPAAPMRFDPGYVYVEAGEEFGRLHAAAYADADTAKISFGSAQWGLGHLLARGGSAYLPFEMARAHLNAGKLFVVSGAPEFSRIPFIVINETAVAGWDWLPGHIADLTLAPGVSADTGNEPQAT